MKDYFERNFRLLYQPLAYFAYNYLQNKEMAEDIVQNAFLKLWSEAGSFESEAHLKRYLYKMVKNDCLNELKAASIHSEILDTLSKDSTEEDAGFFEAVVRAEIYGEIMRAIDTLPAECGKIFRMAYIDHLDNSTIAEQLSISINTVKVQKNKAKKRLREQLQDIYPLLLLFFPV